MDYRIRRARSDDANALHGLMTELARFEQYIDRFAITPEIVLESGFRKRPPDFVALVAETTDDDILVGMAVTYLIPYTYAAKPTLVVKELYVSESARNTGIGEALMRSVAGLAIDLDCLSVRWQVAPWNEDGRRFYERLGGLVDTEWLHYCLDNDACRALVTGDTEGKDQT